MQFVPRLCEGRAPCSWILRIHIHYIPLLYPIIHICGLMMMYPMFFHWWRWVWYLNIGALFRRIIMFGWPRRLVDISYEDCWFPIRKCHESQVVFLWMLMNNVDPFSFPPCLWESKMLIWEPKWKLVTVNVPLTRYGAKWVSWCRQGTSWLACALSTATCATASCRGVSATHTLVDYRRIRKSASKRKHLQHTWHDTRKITKRRETLWICRKITRTALTQGFSLCSSSMQET